jgi:hypothetical protein
MSITVHASDAVKLFVGLWSRDTVRVSFFSNSEGIGIRFFDPERAIDLGRILIKNSDTIQSIEEWAHDEAEEDSLASLCATLPLAWNIWRTLKTGYGE